MNFLGKMERKFGRYAIRNLSLILVVIYAAGYSLQLLAPGVLYNYLAYDPSAVFSHGQVWRLITWVLVPLGRPDLFTFITLFCYYSVGVAMERTWGRFFYNVYVFSSLILTLIGATVIYYIFAASASPLAMAERMMVTVNCTSGYVATSVMLAFAFTYPDAQFLLWFIIPVKALYIGLLDIVFMLYRFINTDWSERTIMLMGVLNFVIYYVMMKRKKPLPRGMAKTRKNYRNTMRSGSSRSAVRKPSAKFTQIDPGGARHRCAICGRTELSDPNLEFRFCSKCEGSYEYCSDHLFTHVHVKNGSKPQITPEGRNI